MNLCSKYQNKSIGFSRVAWTNFKTILSISNENTKLQISREVEQLLRNPVQKFPEE